MTGLNNIKGMVDAELDGKVRRYMWRKNPSQATSAGAWFDISMSPGNPPPKYWFDAPPGVAKAISQSQDGGLYHGANVSPSNKYLRLFTTNAYGTATGLPMTCYICDYLLYYPSIDDSVTDPQILDNTVTLPRYADGQGVQVIAVSVAARTGGQSFSFSYTNQDGVSGRTSQTVVQNASTAVGQIVTSATATNASANPFIGLQGSDTGVRSIESITMTGADVGLFSLILVKPLAQTIIKETTAPYEKDFFIYSQALPIIKDDAFLSFVCLPTNSIASQLYGGDIKVIWD